MSFAYSMTLVFKNVCLLSEECFIAYQLQVQPTVLLLKKSSQDQSTMLFPY